MNFRQIPKHGKPTDLFLARWTCIGALRTLGGAIAMAMFMAHQSKDIETYKHVAPILDQVIAAHISIIGLPLIMSLNAEDIYRNPVLHEYYMRFPSYRNNHQAVRELIKEERQIKEEARGVDAMLEYFGLQELLDLRDSLREHPHMVINTLFSIIHHLVIDRIDQAIRVVDTIRAILSPDDPRLLEHIVTTALARILNVLHDADYAMSCSMILSLHTYRTIFQDMARAEEPRPFIHHGTSRFWAKFESADWKLLKEFRQPLDRTAELILHGPPFPTNVFFEHEGDFTHEELKAPWIDPELTRRGLWSKIDLPAIQPPKLQHQIYTQHILKIFTP